MKVVPGFEIFGGIVLNRGVGRLKAEAVLRIAQIGGGGRIVWLPTFAAENTVRVSVEKRAYVSVVRAGRPVPELSEIFSVIAKHDLVLTTGRSAADESLVLIQAAKRAGVKPILLTHVLSPELPRPLVRCWRWQIREHF